MFSWLALNFVQGIGSIKYKALISRFTLPENVFKADADELCKVDGIGLKIADAIKSFNDYKAVEKEINEAKRQGVKIIKYLDFPATLRGVKDSPPILYVKGDLLKEDDNSFSIVGARKASNENFTFTEEISCKLASKGVTIVSGMAAGIDSAAHAGALKAKGRTIAVLGSGVDIIYPYSNKDLYGKIVKHGAVISELRLGTKPARENFPKRNRVISGLSKGVLVVEAASDSGSLITADYALKQGRALFAVPGDIRKVRAKGTNSLIKKGAVLLDNEDDIFNNIDFGVDSKAKGNENAAADSLAELRGYLSDDEFKALSAMNDDSTHIDDIIKRAELKASQVSAVLLNLELRGYIKQFPGKMFVKVTKF